jgi:hypothetical protein
LRSLRGRLYGYFQSALAPSRGLRGERAARMKNSADLLYAIFLLLGTLLGLVIAAVITLGIIALLFG